MKRFTLGFIFILLVILPIRSIRAEPSRPPRIHIIFFTPSDVETPKGVNERLTKIAEATENFFFEGMKQCHYPAAVTNLFERDTNGLVKVYPAQGQEPASDKKYQEFEYGWQLTSEVAKKYQVGQKGDVWWVFVYLGDPPARYANFRGGGNARDGGLAMVNYDSTPGEIRPDLGLATGFNGQYFLKGTIHELGHTFGLPHLAPDWSLGFGNTLMGPTTAEYARKKYPNPEKIILSEPVAAILWRHPLFSGHPASDVKQTNPKLQNYTATFDAAKDCISISGKLEADQPAHSVVLIDDRGQKDDHWFSGYSARLADDGRFLINIKRPAKTNGNFKILFCFKSGLLTGHGQGFAYDAILKSYQFRDGKFAFDP